MNQTTALQRTDPERAIEFIPYGAADKIKLSVRIIQNMVAVPTRTGKTCNERDALRFLMLCQAQRLNPFAGDAYLVGYDGKDGPSFSLITAHQSFLKRAETCADYEGMESGIILLGDDGTITEREGDFHLEDEKVVGGWARVHRKGRKPTYRRIRMARFNKGFAQWQVDAAGMIVKCAEADALRSTFPTLLGGLYMQGEQSDAGRIVAEMSTTKPIFEVQSRAAALPQHQADDGQDTDLGPAKALQARETAHAGPETPSEKGGAEDAPSGPAADDGGPGALGPLQAWLADGMTAAGVTLDELRAWLTATGYAKANGYQGDVDSIPSWAEVPGVVISALKKDAKAMSKIIKIYGKEQAA